MSTAVEIVLLLLPAIWYAAGVRAVWAQAGRGHGVSGARALSFGVGLAVIAASLFSPLDNLADALFSAHMVQHLLLIMIAAPLLVLGAPLVPMLWALPAARRRAVGGWWNRSRAVRPAVLVLTHPGVAFTLHTLALWFWHFPLPYQAALEHEWLHALEHLSFVGTASLLWWVVLQPVGPRRRPHPLRPRSSYSTTSRSFMTTFRIAAQTGGNLFTRFLENPLRVLARTVDG